MDHLLQFLGALGAGLAALNAALLGYPGDLVPQEAIIITGIANAVVGAMVLYLSRPGLVVYRRED